MAKKLRIWLPIFFFVILSLMFAGYHLGVGFAAPNDGVALTSSMSLTENRFGDEKDIDSGDIVTFSFTLTNNSEDEVKMATLETGIPKNSLHFIHNVKGVTGLTSSSDLIQLTNISLIPHQQLIISFDAVMNYQFDLDTDLNYQAKFVDKRAEKVVEANEVKQKVKKLPDQVKEKLKDNSQTQTGVAL